MDLITLYTTLGIFCCIAYLIATSLRKCEWNLMLCFWMSFIYLSLYRATSNMTQWQIFAYGIAINFWHLVFLPILLLCGVVKPIHSFFKDGLPVVQTFTKRWQSKICLCFRHTSEKDEKFFLRITIGALILLYVASLVNHLLTDCQK